MGLLTETEVQEMVSRLEQQEVDCQTASGTVPVSLYSELLAAYLASETPELSQAKYLMMRIPRSVLDGAEGAELNKLWRIGRNLWAGKTEEVYSSLAGPWSENIQRIVEKLCHSLKQTNLKMVGDVYSDIKISQLSTMLGLDTEQAIDAAISEGWIVDKDRGFVKPSPFREKNKSSSNNEDTLEKIISFVSYMEN